jgi:hypothetical protein
MNRRQGCLEGFLELFMLNKVYGWLQKNVGFGRGPLGCGCGVILLIIFLFMACNIIFGTNWFRATSAIWPTLF